MSAEVNYDDQPENSENLWFDVPIELGNRLIPSGNPWLAALLPLACKICEELNIDGTIDSELMESSSELMEWWRYWFPAMQVVPVRCTSIVHRQNQTPTRTAQFFSGGVDSFFTLLRHIDNKDQIQVNDLLVGWGFDIPLNESVAFEKVTKSLSAIAKNTETKLVTFSTNIRDTRFGRELPWGAIGHGSAMAALALLLDNLYSRVLIPSTDGYRETGPWGSHATTDHYYSSSTMRIIHDGAAYSRLQKVELIATSPIPLGALRVCWRSQADINCGRCEKCLRTMLALELCGALRKAATFSHAQLDLGLVKRIYCPFEKSGSLQLYYLELLNAAQQHGRTDIARAISTAIRNSRHIKILLLVTKQFSQLPILGSVFDHANRILRHSLIY